MTTPNAPQFPVPDSPHTDLQLRDIYRRLALLEQAGVGAPGAPGAPGETGPPGPPGPGGSPADGDLRAWAALLYLNENPGEAPSGIWHGRRLAAMSVTAGKAWMHLEMGIVIWGIATNWPASLDVRITVIGESKFAHWRDPDWVYHEHDTTPEYVPGGYSYWPMYEFSLRVVPTISGLGAMARTVIEPRAPKLVAGPSGGNYFDPQRDFAFIPIQPIGLDVIHVYASLPENESLGVNAFLWGRFLEYDPVEFPFARDFGP